MNLKEKLIEIIQERLSLVKNADIIKAAKSSAKNTKTIISQMIDNYKDNINSDEE